MSDISIRFSPLFLMATAYLTLGPLLAGIVLAVRAVRSSGRIRGIAMVGVTLVLLYFVVAIAMFGAADGVFLAAVGSLCALVGAAWLATAWLDGARRRMDICVAVLPALAGLALVWLDRG